MSATPEQRRRAGHGQKRRSSAAFKSPLHRTDKDRTSEAETTENLKQEIQKLQLKMKDVEKNINKLKESGYRVEELDEHIEMMHQYNDIKDVGQMVLGRIAMFDGVRTKDLYQQYGLDVED